MGIGLRAVVAVMLLMGFYVVGVGLLVGVAALDAVMWSSNASVFFAFTGTHWRTRWPWRRLASLPNP